ncbi:unnamed protein product [Lactuca virosa]|uniref:BHLH domain-containing protein n=1 Tax=Lactuca virosa TaxID=75947 RepID=A0AAU9NRE1_9ASTR|nr:unnamed protein product [Lactuca virosa]
MYGDGGSSDAIARDMNSLLHSSSFKHPPDGEFAKIKELISSDSSYSDYNHHDDEHNHNYSRNQNQGRQIESSLMRYRSAPSSFYASLLDENGCDDFLAPVETSNHTPEEGRERFFSSDQHQQHVFQSDSHDFIQYASKIDTKEEGLPKVNHTPISTAMFGGNSHQMPHVLPPSNSYNRHTKMVSSSTLRTMNPTTSNLIRQSSSPAGFLSSLNAETGFAGMSDVEKPISSSRLNNRISFSSTPSSSPPFLPQISENKNDSTFKSLKRTRDSDSMMFPSSITLDIENGSSRHYSPSLVHHMSLPKTSSEMATAEKFLRFEHDSTPCKIRAKRGCATHPRSIAERVRRTRISERMKKIQSLFPTMDKQTSTADMLDLAVQYIKDLQKELKTLNDARGRCTCSTQQ